MDRSREQMVRTTAQVGLVILMAGCGPSAEQLELKRLGDLVHSLQAQVARQGQRTEELSNRLVVFSHRLDRIAPNGEGGEANASGAGGESRSTPPTLEVVKLEPAPATPAPATAPPDPQEEPPIEIKLVGSNAPPSLGVTVVPPVPQAADAEAVFRGALEAYRAGNSGLAYERFAAFVRDFAAHEYVDNALYWMGECRFEQGRFADALTELAKVVERYPRSNKAADALLKMGLAHERLGQRRQAHDFFNRVISTYPHSALAELARARLASTQGANRRMR